MNTDLLPDFNVGDTVTLEVTLVSPVEPFDPLVIPGGTTMDFGMRREYNQPGLDVSKPLTLINASIGLWTLEILPEDTEDLLPGVYFYAFKLTEPLGGVVTIVEARVTLRPAAA
jgi:hypothetical protein